MSSTTLRHAFAGIDFIPGETMRTRDGTKLVSDVYRPHGDGPWPVLLMRQPYGRDIASTVVYAHPTWFARNGFMVVIQDVRGRGDSEGEFYPFRNEINDGYDTVMWAAALPGSNGRVGMYGFSYQGSTQLLAALAAPPPLRAIAPHMTAFDLYSGWFYRDGILQLSTTLGWANQMLREDAKRRGATSYAALEKSWLNPGALSHALPVHEAQPITNTDLPSYGADWLRHTHRDDYWREFDLLRRAGDLNLPMFHLSGWYDTYLRGSVDGYEAMSRVNENQFLLAAPWAHIPWGRQIGALDFGSEAEPAVDAMLCAWFHHWLDHEHPRGDTSLRGCRYFVIGQNQWRTSETWPPDEAKTQTWFLRSRGRANSRFGDGVLSRFGAEGPDDLFNYDPEVPVTAPGANNGGNATFGPHDLSAQQQSNNLLVYTSAPFTETAVIAGNTECVLHVHSSAEETLFVVRLSVVAASGRATFLTLGCAHARAPYPSSIAVPLDPTAASIAAGECLRIDVASSAFPLLARHPNTRSNPNSVNSPAEFRRALQVVYHDEARPSRLLLPVITVT